MVNKWESKREEDQWEWLKKGDWFFNPLHVFIMSFAWGGSYLIPKDMQKWREVLGREQTLHIIALCTRFTNSHLFWRVLCCVSTSYLKLLITTQSFQLWKKKFNRRRTIGSKFLGNEKKRKSQNNKVQVNTSKTQRACDFHQKNRQIFKGVWIGFFHYFKYIFEEYCNTFTISASSWPIFFFIFWIWW